MSENLSLARYLALKTHANTYKLPAKEMSKGFQIVWERVPIVRVGDLYQNRGLHVGDFMQGTQFFNQLV